jgi:hypothetical protein
MLIVLGCWFSVCGRGLCAGGAQGSLNSPEFPGKYITTLMVASSNGPLAIFFQEGETGYRGEMCADWNCSFCSVAGYAFVFGGATTRVSASGTVPDPTGGSERVDAVLPGCLLVRGHR